MNTFWPRSTQPVSVRSPRVWIADVSTPAVGSVTPKAWRRSSPAAIAGRYACFCSSLPWRRSVPMTYICAWQAAAFPPDAFTSSRIALAVARSRPPPPYSSGMSAASQPALVSAATNSSG